MVMMINVAIFALLAFVIYLKYFQDELVSETLQSATVIDVTEPSGNGVGSNLVKVQVQLEDGANANTMVSLNALSVGQSVDVMVRTYESGSRSISVREF